MRKLIDCTLEEIELDSDVLNAQYPKADRRFNNFKLPNLLKNYPDVRQYYFDKLSTIMLNQFTEKFESGKLDPWTASNHILDSLDHRYVSKSTLNSLTWLLQRALTNQFDSHFKFLIVKDLLMKQVYVDAHRKQDKQFIEFTEILQSIQLFRHSMMNTLEIMVDNDLQGTDFVTQQFLEKYAEMTVLDKNVVMFNEKNDTREKDFDDYNLVRNSYEQNKWILELDEGKIKSDLMLKLINNTKHDKDFMLKEDSYATNLVQDIAQSLYTISEIAETTK